MSEIGCIKTSEENIPYATIWVDKNDVGRGLLEVDDFVGKNDVRRGILDAIDFIDRNDIKRGIPDAMLVTNREYLSRLTSPDVRSDATKNVGISFPDVFFTSPNVFVRRKYPCLL